MRLHELYPFAEERKARRRVGRGHGSGLGSTSGKGLKGQKQRSGGGPRPGFEGGQMPLQRRLPKRGFTNIFRVEYAVINLDRLAASFEGKDEISLDDIYARGLAEPGEPVKILGRGDLASPLRVEAHKFSSSAREKLEKSGGAARALEG
ncbi:MAG: 50S ribosomal protein L15 [Deltaproteobacteria bacterium]|jgi:large subunit ribosomal protein L15|nr:50S ribosomal protein L15 [Deltaproteobacteria bacterium]